MRRFVYQLVDTLKEGGNGLSRNRHFGVLSTPSGIRARRLANHLRSLDEDLGRHGEEALVSVEKSPEGLRLRLEIRALKLVRTAVLTDDDLDVIARHGGPLARALAGHLPAVTP